jgi:hypothetical protein
MENFLTPNSNETLILSKNTFRVLLHNVTKRFKDKHAITVRYKDSQLYGFGNYNSEKPNLKNDLEQILKGYVNGKYLYNKYRELQSGKPIIKISREYKLLFFNYLGYKDIYTFIEGEVLNDVEKKEQLELLNKNVQQSEHYYVCYYFGEDNKMNKGQVFIYSEWGKIEMIYVYRDDAGHKGIYRFYGTIKQSEDFVFFDTKFYIEGKKSEGAKFIFFIGKSSQNERHYLIGTYSGFDKYDRAIAGKMILKKYNSKMEVEEEVNEENFDPIICQELNKNRMVVESSIRKNPLLFSEKSPFSQILLKTTGIYSFIFKIETLQYKLDLKIEKFHYNIISLNEDIIIENDKVSVLSKGQILNFDFSVSGMFHLQKVSIYIKALDFTENKKEAKGSFNGVDINNNIVSGNVVIEAVD